MSDVWAIEEAIRFFDADSPLAKDATAQLAALRTRLQEAEEALETIKAYSWPLGSSAERVAAAYFQKYQEKP